MRFICRNAAYPLQVFFFQRQLLKAETDKVESISDIIKSQFIQCFRFQHNTKHDISYDETHHDEPRTMSCMWCGQTGLYRVILKWVYMPRRLNSQRVGTISLNCASKHQIKFAASSPPQECLLPVLHQICATVAYKEGLIATVNEGSRRMAGFVRKYAAENMKAAQLNRQHGIRTM